MRVEQKRARLHRRFDVGDHRQRFVLDFDQPRGFFCDLRLGSGDDRYRLAGIPNAVASQGRLIPHGARHHYPGQILAGDDRAHTWQRLGPACVDAHDVGVGMRTAQHRAVQHAGHAEVHPIHVLARHFGAGIQPGHGLTDDPLLVHEAFLPASIAARSARRILT
jgi:hypothetical protein